MQQKSTQHGVTAASFGFKLYVPRAGIPIAMSAEDPVPKVFISNPDEAITYDLTGIFSSPHHHLLLTPHTIILVPVI